MRLPGPGNLGEEELQSGPTPVIGKEEESGEALPLFRRNHPVQVFLREMAGKRCESSVHLRITAIPRPYSCQDKVVPLATRTLINRSPKERRCQDPTPFLLWGLPGQLFLVLEEEK